MNYKMVGRVLGMVLLCLTGLMLVPLLAGIIYGENVRPFVLCIALSLALGLTLASIKPDSTELFARDGFLAVGLAWMLMSLLGALPYILSGDIPDFVDALFESVSGFSTTGATVLISSHLLGEMEQMVTQVGIIHHGKMLFEGALRDLKRHSRGDILLRVLDVPRALAALRQNGVAVCEEEGLLRLPPMEDERLAALVCALADSGAGVVGVNEQTRRLEEIFLSLTQNGGEAV